MRSILWREAPLCQVAEIERKTVSPDAILPSDTFVGLEHIDGAGNIDESNRALDSNIASTKFRFTAQHVLYGKLRPYLRKIALPSGGGVCSTDILPLLPKAGVIERRYLFHYLRQPSMIDLATARSAGANLPRLGPSVLADFPVKFPPLDEQRRIAAILDKADAIRRKRQQALALADEFLRSAFLTAIAEAEDGRTVRLAEITTRITDGTHLTPKFVVSGIPFIFVKNFDNGRIDYTTDKYITDEEYTELYRRCPVETGDVLYTTVGATYGQAVAVGNFTRFAFQRHVAHIKPDREVVIPEFLEGVMRLPQVKRQADRRARGAAQPTVNLSDIREFVVPLLSLEKQKEIVGVASKGKAYKAAQTRLLEEEALLFASLSQRAFRGDLLPDAVPV